MEIAKIDVCGIPYTIVKIKDNFDADAIHFGQINYLKSEIVINEDAAFEVRKEAICHEVVHAMLVHIGREDLSNDEQFVQALGNAIHQSFLPRINTMGTDEEEKK